MDPEEPKEDPELDSLEAEQEAVEAVLEPKEQQPLPAERGQLVRLDPLRRYLVEISHFEPLSAEEEKRLALLYREEHDQQAAYRLVSANLKLVVKIAFMYSRIYQNVMDLIQEGNIGLMEAVKRFDPYQGARLPTYATWWIKAYIIKFILDNFRIVRVGTTNDRRKLLFNLRKEKERLRMQGIEPTPALVAANLNVSVEDVKAIDQNLESHDVSLDSFVGEDENTRFSDSLAAADEMIDEKLARGELKRLFQDKFQEFARTLNERERVILNERLIAEEPKTLQELAGRFGVTREAIRLNEKTLVNKIKTYMEEALKDVTSVEFGLIR